MYRPEKEMAGPRTPAEKTREIIARRGALEFKDGMYGAPVYPLPNMLRRDISGIFLH